MDGNRAEVFSRADEMAAMGLDVPQITKLALLLREKGLDIGRDVYTVDYALEQLLAYGRDGKGGADYGI